MDNKDKVKIERLKELLQLQAESYDHEAQLKIAKYVVNMYYNLKSDSDPELYIFDDKFGNTYIVKGSSDLYTCVVAHLDQVHDEQKVCYQIHQDGDVIFAIGKSRLGYYKQVGTGSDDLTGVWLCLELLLSQPTLKVVFFLDEEVGCLGSETSEVEFFKDCSFILQGDRRSDKNDFITYTNGVNVSSKEFRKEVEPILKVHKYKQASGIATDAGQLVINGAGCCTANISCGYFNEHTDQEYSLASLSIGCLNLMEDVISKMSYKRWPMPKQTRKPKYSTTVKTLLSGSAIAKHYFPFSSKDPHKVAKYMLSTSFPEMREPTPWETESVEGYYYYISIWGEWGFDFFNKVYGKPYYDKSLQFPSLYSQKYLVHEGEFRYKQALADIFIDIIEWEKTHPRPDKNKKTLNQLVSEVEDEFDFFTGVSFKDYVDEDSDNYCPMCTMYDEHNIMEKVGGGQLRCNYCFTEIDTTKVRNF
jgi:tripeptide aminopeptidase